MKTGRGHNESRLHGIRKACARRSKSGPTWPARAHRARSPRRSQGAVTETQRPCCINPEMRRTCTHIPSSSRDCAERPAAAVGEVVAADAAVVDSVATTAMRMSFEQAQLGANVTHPLLSRRRWPNGPGTEGHRTRGKSGCPAIGLLWARYRRAKCLLSGEDFHRHRRSKCFHGSEILQ